MNDVISQYRIEKESYYRTVADEVDLYEAAYSGAYADDAQGTHRVR